MNYDEKMLRRLHIMSADHRLYAEAVAWALDRIANLEASVAACKETIRCYDLVFRNPGVAYG